MKKFDDFSNTCITQSVHENLLLLIKIYRCSHEENEFYKKLKSK